MSFPDGFRVMVTGHRSVRGERAAMVRGVLRDILDRVRLRHPEGVVAVCGMAVGADAEFAEAAIEIGVPLVAAVPVETQADPWPPEAQHRYARLLNRACHVVEVWKDPAYAAVNIGAQMMARNRWMLDHSDMIVAVWNGQKSGGTYNAVREAHRRGRKVMVVDPSTGAVRAEAPPEPRSDAKTAGFGKEYGVDPAGSVLGLFASLVHDSVEVEVGDADVLRDLVVRPYAAMMAEIKAETERLSAGFSSGTGWQDLAERGRYKPVFLDADYDQLEMRIAQKFQAVRQLEEQNRHADLSDALRYATVQTGRFRGVDTGRRGG